MTVDASQLATLIENTGEAAAIADNTAPDLRPLSEQLIAIAQALRDNDLTALVPAFRQSHLPHSNAAPSFQSGSAANSDDRRATYVQLAREAYAIRRMRSSIFDNEEIFGEPAWDILLDLYIADYENKPVSVSSACIGSASPPTTGLRWLGVLAEQGLISRDQDPDDQRRILVHLTEHATHCMDRYFASTEKRAGIA